MNIVFFCIDCLREDLLRSDRTETPFLDSMRETGSYYENLFSTTSTTTPSVASFMTGLYSERNGVNSLRECQLNESVPTLAEKLSSYGWQTIAEVTGPLVEETGLNCGFDEYNYRGTEKDLFSEWSEYIHSKGETLSEPFFLYLHLWELHTPLHVPEEYDDPSFGHYPQERILSAIDSSLKNLCEKFPNDTLFIIHGDHGESIPFWKSTLQGLIRGRRNTLRFGFGIDTRPIERFCNRYLNSFAADIADHFIENEHGSTVYDYMINVPLILNGKGIPEDNISAQCQK